MYRAYTKDYGKQDFPYGSEVDSFGLYTKSDRTFSDIIQTQSDVYSSNKQVQHQNDLEQKYKKSLNRIVSISGYHGRPLLISEIEAKIIFEGKTTSSSETINQLTILDTLEEYYVINKRDQVSSYLNENSHLVPIVKELYSEISSHFEEAEFALDLFIDPEYPDEKKLYIVIMTDKEVNEIFDDYEEFELSLIENYNNKISNQIGFTLQFI